MRQRGRHSAVFLAGGFAVKVFKREVRANAKKEFDVLRRIQKFGFAPRPFFRIGGIIVMSRVNGKPVRKMTPDEIKVAAPLFLNALYVLDQMGIKKEESHRPDKHFLICNGKPVLIDFERAHEGRGNVTQFLAFLEKFFPGIAKLGSEYKRTLDIRPIMEFTSSRQS
jgi:putative serine/threonine protein kinase